LLDKAGIANILASGNPDPGILLAGVDTLDDGAEAFIAAAGKHRHPVRETDPPQI
jgi:catalase